VTAGATTADGVFFVLTYFGVARLVTSGERAVLFALGGALMLYLAFSTVRSASRTEMAPQPSPRARSPFLMGLTLGLTNPFQLGWWVAIGAGMVSQFGASIAVGFFAGIVAWTLFMTALVSSGVARYRHLAPLIAYASGALIAAFGLWFLGEGLTAVL